MINFLKSLFSDRNAPAAELEEELLDFTIRTQVRAGYLSRAEIIELAEELAADEYPDETVDIEGMVDKEINALKQEQADWPTPSDYDRLNAQLQSLEEEGIVARQNFSCCGNCGAAEIWDEIETFNKGTRSARGYVFFHEQDTESAVEGGGVYFAYGACPPKNSNADNIAIGQELAHKMRAAGFEVSWNGKLNTRVLVLLDWRRRWENDRNHAVT